MNSSKHLTDFRNFFYIDIMLIFCDECLFTLSVMLSVYAGTFLEFLFLVGLETPKHNALNLIDEDFENLNSISRIFQETHDFLILTDSVPTAAEYN